jgi:hypothetical protein
MEIKMLDLIKTNAPVAAYETNAFAHGIGNSTVSSQWYNRPADQKFLSLTDMLAYKKADAAKLESRIVNTHKIKVIGDFEADSPSYGDITLEYTDYNRQEKRTRPTNWSFSQLAQLAGAPAGYLKDLPAPLVADCLQYGLQFNRANDMVKIYDSIEEGGDIRAATGKDYGRIFDTEIIEPILNISEERGGRWKVPGLMTGQNQGRAIYDPEVPVTPETTTLFASDRDVLFSWWMIATQSRLASWTMGTLIWFSAGFMLGIVKQDRKPRAWPQCICGAFVRTAIFGALKTFKRLRLGTQNSRRTDSRKRFAPRFLPLPRAQPSIFFKGLKMRRLQLSRQITMRELNFWPSA